MMRPTIHLNGTSRNELQRQLLGAVEAIRDAEQALIETTPHGRDYYLQGTNAINAAMDEHLARRQRLASVRGELETLLEGLIDNRKFMR